MVRFENTIFQKFITTGNSLMKLYDFAQCIY